MKHLLAPVLVASLFVLGCPPCEQLCEAEADTYALCLGEWGMNWANVGVAGGEEYRFVCKEEAELESGRRDADERREANSVCSQRNTDLRASDDCTELYEILEGFDTE